MFYWEEIMRIKLFASVILASSLAQAQVPSVLIEACNALPDADKRLECLKATMQQGAAPVAAQASNVAAIDTVDKAFNRMKANLGIGISYNNYQTALLDLAQAVSELKRVGTSLSAEGLVLLDDALETYSDAGKFWERSISFYAQRDNSLSYFGGLPVGLTSMEWLVNKYSLSTTRADLLGFHTGLHVSNTRTTLWDRAATKAVDGVQALKQIETAKVEAANAAAAAAAAKAKEVAEAAKQAAAIAESERQAKLRFVDVDGLSWQRPILSETSTAISIKAKRADITTAVGTPVYAAASGRVTYAGAKLKGFGKMVVIKHDDRYQTAYAQNSKLQVSEGDAVTQGQVIAESGETLWYEVRIKGSTVNPTPYWPAK
jgi:murein DD-endopeptidase MepM/ murein hydrolase activator NlpD